jgi:CHAT domain-containing protein
VRRLGFGFLALTSLVTGAVWILAVSPAWLASLFSPGVNALVGVTVVATSVVAGLDSAVRRRTQRGVWRWSSYLTAVPVALLVWWQGPHLSAWAGHRHGVAVTVVVVLLSLRGLAEVTVATSFVGAFLAPDSAVLVWYAMPSLAALYLGSALLLWGEGRLHGAAKRAIGARQGRSARLLVLASMPLALLNHGANRAKVTSFVGTVYALTGDPGRAVSWKRWSAAIERRRGLRQAELDTLQDLATVQHSAGRYDDALMTLARAWKVADERGPYVRRATSGGSGPTNRFLDARARYDRARLALLEGQTRRDAGDVQGALDTVSLALEPFETDDGLASHGISLAEGLRRAGRAVPADVVAGARRLERELAGMHADLLSLKAQLVGSLLHDEQQAVVLLDQSRRIAAQAGDRAREFLFICNQASSQVRLRRHGEARASLERALRLAETEQLPIFGRDSDTDDSYVDGGAFRQALALCGLANLKWLQGRTDEAAELYEKALALATPGAPSIEVTARIGIGLVRLARGQTAAARADIDAVLAQLGAPNSEAFLRVAHLWAGRAYEQDGDESDLRTALEHYTRAVALVESGRASLAAERERLQFLGSDWRVEVYERTVVTCVKLGRAADAFNYAERAKARALLERLDGGRTSDAVPIRYADAREMLAAAGRPALLVEYFTAAETTVVIGVRADRAEAEAVAVPVDRDALRRFALTNFGSAGRVRELVTSGLEELWHGYDALVAPVAAWAQPGELVVLVPHGLLHYLPLHALHLDGRPLIERHPLCYAPSSSVLRACRRNRGTQRRWQAAAVFGDPTGDLPQARVEAQAVAELVRTTVVAGPSADRSAFLTAVATADVLHYAGHARFDTADPMGSALLLYGGDTVTAREIAGIPDIPAWLVTLSGCETGVSLHHPGDDLVGMLRGFLYAGAPAVLASLWRVPDTSTAHLVIRFYEYLRDTPGIGKADALQRAILDTRDNVRWTTLYHWAPFVLVGDWE